jgi:hypothetical protein
VCPHLAEAGYRVAEITREDVLGDGHPLPARRAPWRQQWTIRPGASAVQGYTFIAATMSSHFHQ